MKFPWMRKLLIGIGVLVLLTGAVLGYLIATFDANAYKGLAVDWMKTHRDRTLVIGGPVKLAVFPRLAVEVSGITLSEKGRADEFLSLDDAALSVSVLPLLRKQVVVDRVSARGLRMNFVRNEKGVANIDDLLASEPAAPTAPEPASAPAGSGPALRLDVNSVKLDDLRVTLRDERAKLAGVLTLKSLNTGRLADQIESPVGLDAQIALTQPALQGELTGSTLLTPDFAAKGVRLRDMQLGWKGRAPGVQAATVSLRGGLAFDGTLGTLRADAVELSGTASLGSLKLADSTLAVERFAYNPDGKELQLSKLRVQLGGTTGGQPLNLSLDWPELSVKSNSLTGSALSGKVRLQGDTAVDASFKTAAPSGSFERIVVPSLETTLSGRSGPRQLSGTLQATLLLHPEQGMLALNDIDTRLRFQGPALQPLAMAIQGKADASSTSAHWALKGQINNNPFHSDGQAILATTPPTLNAKAQFEVLDLNSLLPTATEAASAPPAPAEAKADIPVDLSALRELQGRLDLRIGQFSYRQYRVSDAVAAATLEGGMLRITQLAGKAWNGGFDATAFADARASRVALTGRASGINVNALLKDVAGKDLLEGSGQLALDVETAGASVNEMKSRLKGRAGLQLKDGAIKGIDLAKVLRPAKSVLSGKPSDERHKADSSEKTAFTELSASFAIADGVARNNDLDVKNPLLRLGGDGSLDIGKGRIDYTVRATITSSLKGADGTDLLTLKGLTIPVHLSGPFEAMDWRVEWTSVVTQTLKTDVGTQVRDKLMEKLGLRGPAKSASAASAAGSSAAPAASQPDSRHKLTDQIKGLFK
ncbi:MAG TPA: AsmA family protein [Rhizobacter sp.]|nr:AsmA family protein [Rhizobacter sp.]